MKTFISGSYQFSKAVIVPTSYIHAGLISVVSKNAWTSCHTALVLRPCIPSLIPNGGSIQGKVTALLRTPCIYDWFWGIGTGAFYLIESIDCDSVPHRELVNLLYSGGHFIIIIHWLKRYLIARQKVVIGGDEPKTIPVISSVPKRSLLDQLF